MDCDIPVIDRKGICPKADWIEIKNLYSLILPQEKIVIIEKNAFLGCEHLRNVISLNNEIQINDGAFSACPQDLTFICVENSNADIYSREHGNKVIYVSSSFKF